jgi:hypothetical protein
MFQAQHRTELHADYLRTIDSARVKAENIPLFTRFYDQVSVLRILIEFLLLILK